ncbi:MAG: hypothetical protein KW793_04905 [Candidatus Doudnabacteria bacterium]|nr:hypothetical protein [Candidatus Doudnabacteria bacterium]
MSKKKDYYCNICNQLIVKNKKGDRTWKFCSQCRAEGKRLRNREYPRKPIYRPKDLERFDTISRKREIYGQSIDKVSFFEWHEVTPKVCYYCGVQEDVLAISYNGYKGGKSVLTIDRKDNTKGYIKGNMCFACHRCNTTKGNFFTESEWLEIANKYIKPRLVIYHTPTPPRQ